MQRAEAKAGLVRDEIRPAIHRLYGLTIETSIDLPYPRLVRGRKPDVRLRPAGAAHFDSLRPGSRAGGTGTDWFCCRRLENRSTYLRWEDSFEFVVSADGHTIEYQALAQATLESFTTYLLGQVLSFSLIAFGNEPLHGTAVVINGRAVAFLGDCGRGKSTLGAAFLARGHPIVSDDLLALASTDTGYDVHPGVPRIKLFPSVSRRVLGVDGGAKLNGGTSKQVLPLAAAHAWPHPVRLSALYVLAPPRARPHGITIERLSLSDALMEMIRHSFNTIVLDRDRLARQFSFASHLATQVPVKRLFYPRRLALLPAVCDAVLGDLFG